MRASLALGTSVSLLLLCAAIVASGHVASDAEPSPVAVEPIDPDMLPAIEPDKEARLEADSADKSDRPQSTEIPDKSDRVATPSAAQGAAIHGSVGQPPEPSPDGGAQRIAPRKPLSPLGQARTPAPEKKADWDGTPLYRPVATAAGTFEAMGYTVNVAGTKAVAADETCSYRGTVWPCGVIARTAFRSLLRGRAVICALPAAGEEKSLVVDCRIGTQGLGEWLVENGWARAVAGGPYSDAGHKAEEDGKGIFGRPPRNLE